MVVKGLEPCVATRKISSDVNYSTGDKQEASSIIIAENKIASGSSAIYRGGNDVSLLDGLKAESRSVFRAYIEECSNECNARKGAAERPVVKYNVTLREFVIPESGNEISK